MESNYDDIIVEAELQHGGFDPNQKSYIHKYKITVSNKSDITFQLISRRWNISDGLSWNKVVEGPGVIGQQPVLRPGESFSYNSWCPMPSTAGYMSGHYNCIDLDNQNKPFQIDVPQMNFVALELLN